MGNNKNVKEWSDFEMSIEDRKSFFLLLLKNDFGFLLLFLFCRILIQEKTYRRASKLTWGYLTEVSPTYGNKIFWLQTFKLFAYKKISFSRPFFGRIFEISKNVKHVDRVRLNLCFFSILGRPILIE